MKVKYIINDEVYTDRVTLQNKFHLSKTRLHNLVTNINPSLNYKGFFLYKYDDVLNHLKKNENVSEASDMHR